MRLVTTMLLGGGAVALFVASIVAGPQRALAAAIFFVLAAMAALLAVAAYQRFAGRDTRALMAFAVLVLPLIAIGGSFDLPETVNPLEYLRDREYRAAAHERWRASKWRFLGDVLGLFAIIFLAASVIGFWIAAVYMGIRLMRPGG